MSLSKLNVILVILDGNEPLLCGPLSQECINTTHLKISSDRPPTIFAPGNFLRLIGFAGVAAEAEAKVFISTFRADVGGLVSRGEILADKAVSLRRATLARGTRDAEDAC